MTDNLDYVALLVSPKLEYLSTKNQSVKIFFLHSGCNVQQIKKSFLHFLFIFATMLSSFYVVKSWKVKGFFLSFLLKSNCVKDD